MKKKWILYGAIHALLILCALLFPLYGSLIELIPERLRGCALHDILFVYCPLCGGTRCIEALCSWELATAVRQNAYVVVLIFTALLADLHCLVSLIRKRTPTFPTWFWITLVLSAFLWGILRNVLLIGFGIDPTGDLGRLRGIIQ